MQYYTTYFYKFKSNIEKKRVMEFVSKNRDRVGIVVRQIVNESIEEKLKILNGIILSERSQKCDENCINDIFINVIEYADDRFFAILSVNHERCSENDVKALFRSITINTEPTYLNTGISEQNTLAFWDEVVRDFSLAGKRRFLENMERDMDIAFPITLKNSDQFSQILSQKPLLAKVYLSSAVSKVMCLINNSSGIIFEDIHETGKLSKIPVRVDESLKNMEGREKLQNFFSLAENKDFISYEVLSKKTNTDLDNVGMFSQRFVHEKTYSEYFKKMKVDTLYRIEPLSPGNVPLFVTYRMHEEDKLICYRYDSNFFKKINIEGFHEAVCKLVDSYISDSNEEPDISKLIFKKGNLDEKIHELKVKCLSGHPLFKEYSKKDLERVSEKFEIKQAYSQQDIISKKQECDKLYIIVKGKFEVSGTDFEGIIRPLCFIKEKDIFGIESLCVDKVSKVSYTAYSEQCVYMSVSKEDIMEEIKNHTNMVNELLEAQSKMLDRFQKLWMMS